MPDVAETFGEHAEHVRNFSLPRERAAWLEFRRTGLGGSDAAALMGMDPSRGPREIYDSKVGEPRAEDEVWNEAAHWGHALEDVVAQEFERRVGLKVYHPTAMLRSRAHPFMLATMDRWVLDPEGGLPPTFLEVKTRSPFKRSEYGSDPLRVEPKVYAQCQHYMVVAGVQSCHLAVLFGGQAFEWYLVPRDQGFVDRLIEVEYQFWTRVVNREPPTVREVVEEQRLEVTPELRELFLKHRDVVRVCEQFDRIREDVEAKIKTAVGSRKYLLKYRSRRVMETPDLPD